MPHAGSAKVQTMFYLQPINIRARVPDHLAVAAFEAASADIAEYFILESARCGGALPFIPSTTA